MRGSFLGVDIGGTASRFVLLDNTGAVMARGAGGGANGHVFNPTERERLRGVFVEVSAAIDSSAPIDGACLGITGFGPGAADEIRAMVAGQLRVPPDSVLLCDDMELVFRTVFVPGEGHLISAGTGSIGLHVAADDTLTRVGGRGLLIDDGGSGTWIALRALDALYRRIDETGSPSGAELLSEELSLAMGGSDWNATRSFIYGGDRGRIGTLAQSVARAAHRGDPLAEDVLARAGRELARLGKALIGRVGERPLGFVGGVITLHPIIKSSLMAELPGQTIQFPQADAALFAAQWARRAAQEQTT
jgi:glucosamine kinase